MCFFLLLRLPTPVEPVFSRSGNVKHREE